MTTIANFEVTPAWQEITGVSEVSDVFTLQNRGSRLSCLLVLGGASAPTTEDNAMTLKAGFERVLDNTINTEKIWIKTQGNNSKEKTVDLAINQGG